LRLLAGFLIALGLCAQALTASAEESGYSMLPRPQPTEPGRKVEVIEFFAYYCPHCNALDPELTAWAKAHAGQIVFKRVPTSMNGEPMAQQRLYYALESMGEVEQYHAKVYYMMHTLRRPVRTDEEAIALAADMGLDRNTFVSHYYSSAVQDNVQHALEMMRDYDINAWPTIIIDGTYATSPPTAAAGMGIYNEKAAVVRMLKIMDKLVDDLAQSRS
jgi:protein dithiol oxidoreductase (disulfide-forming)